MLGRTREPRRPDNRDGPRSRIWAVPPMPRAPGRGLPRAPPHSRDGRPRCLALAIFPPCVLLAPARVEATCRTPACPPAARFPAHPLRTCLPADHRGALEATQRSMHRTRSCPPATLGRTTNLSRPSGDRFSNPQAPGRYPRASRPWIEAPGTGLRTPPGDLTPPEPCILLLPSCAFPPSGMDPPRPRRRCPRWEKGGEKEGLRPPARLRGSLKSP